ncbi:hypothetical protein BJX63DRAFT_390492 [Aspergillus granulosus]|uniref:Uncharacterized protein n=1 Tax=Aspergillus granulosus TaxID=176169 RepID=A0ABR4HI15_9EURO
MADHSSGAINEYKAKIQRLAGFLSGYDWFSQKNTRCEVSLRLMNVDSTQHVDAGELFVWRSRRSPDDLYSWLIAQPDTVATRYVLVEDLDPTVCLPLGAAFDLDPQFFIDHMSNQVPGVGSQPPHHNADWNCWNLSKPYTSFRWYRPIARYDSTAATTRKQIEEQSYDITASEAGWSGEFEITQFHPGSSIFRPEWDLSLPSASLPTATQVAAIEERVSIYEVERDRCKYVIMLLDPIPTCLRLSWDVTLRNPSERMRSYIAPPNAERVTLPLYKRLVPRFPIDINSSNAISSLDDRHLDDIYTSCLSTMEYLNDPIHLEPDEPFLRLFQIVVSDTLGLLYHLHNLQRGITAATVSQDAQLEDILSLRAFIADLQSQLPTLSLEIEQGLEALSDRFTPTEVHQAAITQVSKGFEQIIPNMKETLNSVAAALQFMESHRAILEAESITRLTELAFLFIPLSFAASLFSMQIQELATPAPVAYFVAFALSLSATTYSLRLLARSSWINHRKEKLLASVRRRSALPLGAPVANTAVLAWIYAEATSPFVRAYYQVLKPVPGRIVERVGAGLLTIMLIPFVLVPPLVVVWVRPLDETFKVALTFVFLLFVFSIFSLIAWATPDARDQIFRWLQPSRRYSRRRGWRAGIRVNDEDSRTSQEE